MGKSLDDIVGDAAADDDLEIDFSGAKDFTPIVGDVRARVTNVDGRNKDGEALVSKKGERMVKITWEVIDGEHEGRTIYERWMFEGAGSGITRDKLRVLGLEPDGERLKMKKSDLVGKEATLEMGLQKSDEKYHEVKKIKATPKKAAAKNKLG